MHRNKDVILGEDGYTNRSDNAPRNIFSLLASPAGSVPAITGHQRWQYLGNVDVTEFGAPS